MEEPKATTKVSASSLPAWPGSADQRMLAGGQACTLYSDLAGGGGAVAVLSGGQLQHALR